jgi:hypothetical protein
LPAISALLGKTQTLQLPPERPAHEHAAPPTLAKAFMKLKEPIFAVFSIKHIFLDIFCLIIADTMSVSRLIALSKQDGTKFIIFD